MELDLTFPGQQVFTGGALTQRLLLIHQIPIVAVEGVTHPTAAHYPEVHHHQGPPVPHCEAGGGEVQGGKEKAVSGNMTPPPTLYTTTEVHK